VRQAERTFGLSFHVMRKILPVPALFLAVILCAVFPAIADTRDSQIDAILNSAESLFKMMKTRDYKGIWPYLSDASRGTIVNDTRKAIVESDPAAKSDARYSKDAVEGDFRSGGPIAKSYWDGYLQHFNPDWLLEQSKWQMGKIEKGRAEILIQYQKGEGPVHLLMMTESGKWKVGLMETFRSSKSR